MNVGVTHAVFGGGDRDALTDDQYFEGVFGKD